MRAHALRFVIVLSAVLFGATAASAQSPSGFVQGFGGVTFGDNTADTTYGGTVAGGLTSNIQLIGEAGYIRDTRPSDLVTILTDVGLSVIGVTVRVPAFYAEGGVRVSSGGPVAPYVEGTVGAARLRTVVDLDDGIGFGVEDIVNRVLGTFDRTEPLVGFGGGVMVRGGAFVFDAGYRYKRVFTDVPINVNVVRAGIGFRF